MKRNTCRKEGSRVEKHLNEKEKLKKTCRVIFVVYCIAVILFVLGHKFCFAAEDSITVVNNLSTFIFSLIRAIGMILLGLGIMQVGLSLKSHDPSQRANGFLTLAGGIVITFTKEILDIIVG